MAYVAPEVWYQQLATFYAAAGGLIRDQHDRVLLVKPTYRDHWTLPGGVVEADETPDHTCAREVHEELNLKIQPTRLLVVDWAPPLGKRPRPFIYFIFDIHPITADQPVTLQTDELEDYAFFPVEQATRRVAPHVSQRIPAAMQAATTGATIYLPFTGNSP